MGLKKEVKDYWNKQACGTFASSAEKYSQEYFDEIEEYRYSILPEIFSFAQFSRFNNKKILEVGIGAGTDFLQWVRAGARAYGIDLTDEAVEHVRKRLDIYGLTAEEIKVADIENLSYQDNSFDLVYSYGVIHHSPDTIRALEEIIRVTRIGGRIKIMIYNRRSLNALSKYFAYGLFRGKPFCSISSLLYKNMESIGTKAYTFKEVRDILSKYPVRINKIQAPVSEYDLKWTPRLFKVAPFRFIPYILAYLFGFEKVGWCMNIDLQKTDDL